MSINKKRGGAAARGAVAATVATAVLLGGFGGFSLWQDTATGGINDSITTGQLRIQDVEAGDWYFANNDTDMTGTGITGIETPIADIANWLVSPGDELIYNTFANVLVTGDDMLGEFSIDQSSYTINDPDWDGFITVSVNNANQTIFPDVNPQRVPVKITVKFSDQITGLLGQDAANVIDLSALTVQLDQVQAPTPAPVTP
ncbi:alternate-type signal peptide domain-containing protein [Leucobacter sp. UT-8R-CII-1-4]|uniref:alternate-type signal peptide domain-containing protein n=1 Tax=Leucobacter sp. UT-8R-CII-1-4 TaxID=3040075 RepID=UPI0024A8E2A2|nr:alternate-type signal peptide domain-containing protein [Leucobacter sp. UT-8R-CII-1-4]MDI6022816.1 alternate-type signal peptide domain-containing protein [Leucobacter sp. UT-8R-CII-1-4]